MNDLSTLAESTIDLTMRQKIERMEVEMRKLPQLDGPLKHYFAMGVYARELTIPKDALLTGKIHKYEQINILSKGDISVLTDNGVRRVQAPFTIVSPPGTKRIAYAHEECVWTTIHGTFGMKLSELDLDQIEHAFIAQCDAEYVEFERAVMGEEAARVRANRDDYELFLVESGFTQEWVAPIVERTEDYIDRADVLGNLELRPSVIHGDGLFAKHDLASGELIAVARYGDKRTAAGRYTNHSARPNARFMPVPNGDILMLAITDIMNGVEVTIDYRQAAHVNGNGMLPDKRRLLEGVAL